MLADKLVFFFIDLTVTRALARLAPCSGWCGPATLCTAAQKNIYNYI